MDQTFTSKEEFMLMIKKFATLLHPLFTNKCPQYKVMYGIVKALRGYSTNTKSQVFHKVKKSSCGSSFCNQGGFHKEKLSATMHALGGVQTWKKTINTEIAVPFPTWRSHWSYCGLQERGKKQEHKQHQLQIGKDLRKWNGVSRPSNSNV